MWVTFVTTFSVLILWKQSEPSSDECGLSFIYISADGLYVVRCAHSWLHNLWLLLHSLQCVIVMPQQTLAFVQGMLTDHFFTQESDGDPSIIIVINNEATSGNVIGTNHWPLWQWKWRKTALRQAKLLFREGCWESTKIWQSSIITCDLPPFNRGTLDEEY